MNPERANHVMYSAKYLIEVPAAETTITAVQQDSEFSVVTTGARSLTLARPTKAGLRCKVVHKTRAGDLTLTVTGGYDQAASATLTLGTAGDWVAFHSVLVGSSYYWRVLGQEGITEITAGTIDVHGLTAAAATPDVADLLAISDESASGDPSLAFTVTELLTAAGDLTDLAAVPAVDDRILLTDESASGDPAKSTTVENFFSALGDVTALAAAPATNDLMVVTDESESGDPVRAVTVTEFLTAAGDLTDLAAAPALDDRLLVTDESAAGDPAKSMSVQNLMDARATAVNSSGVGAKNGATVAVAETGVPGHLMKTVLTCTTTPVTISDEAGQGQYGGVKVYDWPAGLILVLGCVVDGALTAGVTGTIIDNWDGDIGLGVEAPTDHQDATNKVGSVMQKNDVSAGAADKIGVAKAKTIATALTESGARWLDGTSAAKDLYANFLIDDDVSHTAGTATFTGTITIWWINLGTLSA